MRGVLSVMAIASLAMAGCLAPGVDDASAEQPAHTPHDAGPGHNQEPDEVNQNQGMANTTSPDTGPAPLQLRDGRTTFTTQSDELRAMRVVSDVGFHLVGGGRNESTEDGFVFVVPDEAAACSSWPVGGVVARGGNLGFLGTEVAAGTYWIIGRGDGQGHMRLDFQRGDDGAGPTDEVVELSTMDHGWSVEITSAQTVVDPGSTSATATLGDVDGEVAVFAFLQLPARLDDHHFNVTVDEGNERCAAADASGFSDASVFFAPYYDVGVGTRAEGASATATWESGPTSGGTLEIIAVRFLRPGA